MKSGDHMAAAVKLPRSGDHDAAGTKLGEHAHDPPILKRRGRTGNLKPMRFVSLHHHSTFSYLDGYQLPEAHIRRAQELGMGALAMTEHGNIDSHVKFEVSSEGTGVKPIFGCELYTGRVGEGATQRKNHLTVLAKSPEGYANLLALVTRSYSEGFYYEPTVNWRMLRDHKKGLVILSGCQGSLLFCSAVGGKGIGPEEASYRRALSIARRFKEVFGESYFIEVQAFPELEATKQANPILARIARVLSVRLVATMDCHYTALEEAEVQKILHNLRPGEKRTIEEQAREWGYDVPLCPPPNDRSIYRRLRATGLSKDEAVQAIISTEEIAQESNVELPKLPMVRFPVPAGERDAKAYWRKLLKEGWKFRGMDKRPSAYRERAKEQLRHETELIEAKDFVDYHLLVRAGVVFIKDQGIPVGPARGSAAASLACYLLRITEVNPLEFPYLRFDRYISVDRTDLPDIDLDFPGSARPMLRDFYESMLGEGCVSNVGTFNQFKGKNSLDDVARVFGVPKFEVERLKDFLIERTSGDMRASSTVEDTIEQFPQAREVWEKHPALGKAQLLEGNVKSFGVHAAGIVLSNQPIRSVTATLEKEVPKGSGNVIQVVAVDKKDAERQGMVKMDFLALNAMQMLWDSISWIDMSLDDLYGLPLDDPKVYKLFKANDVVGVFQFDGRANRYVGGSVQPEQFSEIMDCIALCRPGPLHNGGAREYADLKHRNKKVDPPHPSVADITELTKYQIIYQEQVLDICRIVGDFDKVAVSTARKIIAKKEGEQAFSRMKQRFIDGAATLPERADYPPMSEEQARTVFGDLITSGAYAFNAAHSAAYGLISYWTAWFKVYHPPVFYAASLNGTKTVTGRGVRGQSNRMYDLVRDADRHGVRVLPPDPKRSESGWAPVSKKTIQAGFEQIEGVGESKARDIIEYREADGLERWSDLIEVKGIGPKTVERIEEWVSQEDPLGAFKLAKNIAKVKAEIESGDLDLPTPTHTSVEIPFEQGVQFEVTWLGSMQSRNIRDIFEQNRARTGEELDRDSVKDPQLNEWALLGGEDEVDQCLLKIDRWKYPKFKQSIFDFRMGHDLLLVEGVRPRYVSSRQIKVKRLWVIDPD